MSNDASRAMDAVYAASFRLCSESPFATIGEGQLKGAILRALLQAGFSVLEGSTKNTGKVLSLQDGAVAVTLAPLPPMPALAGSTATRWSPDVRIWEPIRLVAEIQARSIWGTQDALFSKNLLNDLDRICSGLAHFFVFCCDLPIYLALLGEKTDTRGRKAAGKDIFCNLLPHPDSLSSTPSHFKSKCGPYSVIVSGGLTPPIWGVQRVVLVIVGDKESSSVAAAG